ncbi:uncharacterized protein L969DRAFT_82880 [Mixia osmundae IAM 14324]|uniref:Rho-GAP domain-containing protein n=1 Tax=Mixia osmundae (strain CBS 9802 / IAM 14324 / JCM 22182 / KY 12970) TaxID=764103 RepID=G7DX43_MIXOS|nr:uncharacterized protein L969DRAFT_82880 [Mixia osmundae IAM 14324]KEI38052.1 hypothetical protein L969DRAFT_82880 [Mixia osmundae IAM 14324]GAA95140.1 hypothetical protein E5Q_01795 [Mixia osmundae IAM 14324]
MTPTPASSNNQAVSPSTSKTNLFSRAKSALTRPRHRKANSESSSKTVSSAGRPSTQVPRSESSQPITPASSAQSHETARTSTTAERAGSTDGLRGAFASEDRPPEIAQLASLPLNFTLSSPVASPVPTAETAVQTEELAAPELPDSPTYSSQPLSDALSSRTQSFSSAGHEAQRQQETLRQGELPKVPSMRWMTKQKSSEGPGVISAPMSSVNSKGEKTSKSSTSSQVPNFLSPSRKTHNRRGSEDALADSASSHGSREDSHAALLARKRKTSFFGLVSKKSDSNIRHTAKPKANMYGVSLSDLAARDGQPVPAIMDQCFCQIEAKGLDEVGIYRISGEKLIVDAIKAAFDKADDPRSVNLSTGEYSDPHCVAGALKLWFRELPEPPIPYSAYGSFIAVNEITTTEQRIRQLRKLVRDLPEPNASVVKRLFEHLDKVLAHSSVNQMAGHNLAIIFSPALLKPIDSNESFALSMSNFGLSANVIKDMINHSKWIYSDLEELNLSSSPCPDASKAAQPVATAPASPKRSPSGLTGSPTTLASLKAQRAPPLLTGSRNELPQIAILPSTRPTSMVSTHSQASNQFEASVIISP